MQFLRHVPSLIKRSIAEVLKNNGLPQKPEDIPLIQSLRSESRDIITTCWYWDVILFFILFIDLSIYLSRPAFQNAASSNTTIPCVRTPFSQYKIFLLVRAIWVGGQIPNFFQSGVPRQRALTFYICSDYLSY